MEQIEKNDLNLNNSRYISTAISDEEINLKDVNKKLKKIEKAATKVLDKHNKFLAELGLPLLP